MTRLQQSLLDDLFDACCEFKDVADREKSLTLVQYHRKRCGQRASACHQGGVGTEAEAMLKHFHLHFLYVKR